MRRLRVIFWAHAAVTFYCVVGAMLDATGHSKPWMISTGVLFYPLALSALLFPAMAWNTAREVRPGRPGLLLFTHVAMSFAQLFFGLLPLIS